MGVCFSGIKGRAEEGKKTLGFLPPEGTAERRGQPQKRTPYPSQPPRIDLRSTPNKREYKISIFGSNDNTNPTQNREKK